MRSWREVIAERNQDSDCSHLIPEDIDTEVERTVVEHSDDEHFAKNCRHEWDRGCLMFGLLWKTGVVNMAPFSLIKTDYPSETGEYIMANKIGSSVNGKNTGRYLNWAQSFQMSFKQVVRRMIRL